jgi:FAD/FMN-containing dehydrogenase
VADSNIHIGVRLEDEDPQPETEIDDIVYDCVGEYAGSVSAEHGIGLLKRPYLAKSRSPDEVAAMRTLKRALDPTGILNPGKIFA